MIGFFQPTHTFGKVAHSARIENNHGYPLRPQQRKRLLLISPGRLHGYQFHLMLSTKDGQLSDSLSRIGKTSSRTLGADPRLQGTRSNVYSANDLGHGNLPGTCDWKSGDCSVVRASGGGPKAHTRLFNRRDYGRRPPRGGFDTSDPSQRHSITTLSLLYRYKGPAPLQQRVSHIIGRQRPRGRMPTRNLIHFRRHEALLGIHHVE